MPQAPVTILGGLPVIAECSFGVDDSPICGRDYWSEVDALYWQKRDGTAGKEVSQTIYDKLDKYDTYWEASVIEQVSDYLAYEQYREKEELADAKREEFRLT